MKNSKDALVAASHMCEDCKLNTLLIFLAQTKKVTAEYLFFIFFRLND